MVNHDRLFKELLSTFFAEFIELFLPEVATYLDRTSLVFLDKELFTDVTAGSTHEADLVVRARVKDTDSFFLIHTETQSQHEPNFPKRLFGYFAKLHEKYNLPVYPIALFSFDRPRTKQPSVYEVRFPDRQVLYFTYRVIQLNQLSWRQFLGQSNPVAAALMAKMQIAPADRARVKLECLLLLTTLKLDPARLRMISGFIDTYLELTADEMEKYKRKLSKVNKPGQEAVMEIVTSWMKEGLEKGLQQGRQEGHQEGLQEGCKKGMVLLVTKLLNRRLGTIEPSLLAQVQQLPAEQLEVLSEDLLEFATVAQLEQWLTMHKS